MSPESSLRSSDEGKDTIPGNSVLSNSTGSAASSLDTTGPNLSVNNKKKEEVAGSKQTTLDESKEGKYRPTVYRACYTRSII